MLETILAEHNNLPENMRKELTCHACHAMAVPVLCRWAQELEEFEADLESRRNAEERHIGLLSVMPLERIDRVTIQV